MTRWAAFLVAATLSSPLLGQAVTSRVGLTQTVVADKGTWLLTPPQVEARVGWTLETEGYSFRLEAEVTQESSQVFLSPGRTGGRLSWPGVGWAAAGWKVSEGETLQAFGLQNSFGVTPLLRFLERAGRSGPDPEFLLETGASGDLWAVSAAWAPFEVPGAGLDPTSFWFPAQRFPSVVGPPQGLDKPYVRRAFLTPPRPSVPSYSWDPAGGAWEARVRWFLPWFTAGFWGFVGQDRSLQYRTSLENHQEYPPHFDAVLEPWTSRVRVAGGALQGSVGDLGWTAETRWVGGLTLDTGGKELVFPGYSIALRSVGAAVDLWEGAAGVTWRWPAWGLTAWSEGKGWLVGSGGDIPVPALGRAVAGGLLWEQGRGPWSVQVQGLWEASDRSGAVYGLVSYQAESGEKWSLAVPRFFGRSGTLFGTYTAVQCLQLCLDWAS